MFSVSLNTSHHTCHYVSLYSIYTPSCTLHSSSGEKLFLVKDENLRALVTGRSLFRLPLSGTTSLLTSDTAVLSHTSKLLLKPFSLLLHTLSYTIPFSFTETVILFNLVLAADIFAGWLMIFWEMWVRKKLGKKRKQGVAILCVYALCVGRWRGGGRGRRNRVRYVMQY